MTYLANPPTRTSLNALNNQYYQFQQNLWNFEYGEDRTSVTYPSTANETAFDPAKSQVFFAYEVNLAKDLRIFFELISEAHQSLPASTQNWHYFARSFETSPSSTETFHSLVKFLKAWREKTSSAVLLSEVQLQQIENSYVFRNTAEVKNTLREYPFLSQLLLDTRHKIEAHFTNSQVFLEVAIDYEAFDQYSGLVNNDNKELVVSISTSLPPQEALKKLKEFYNSWWSKASKETKGKISVGLEFL